MRGSFTPGPWKAAPFSSIVGWPISAQPDPKRNTVIIAGVHGFFGEDYRAEVEANARLIAAAPELLAACRVAECAVEELCIGQDPANQCWVTLAEIRAAITKATGGAA
jgi:hypothetical protein